MFLALRARLRHRQAGFTLIELLIVVAIIGLIATILIPNLLDALQKAKQKRTVADMKLIGTSWFSWLTDNAGAAAAGSAATFTWSSFNSKSYTDLVADLTPRYASEVPRQDGWGRDFEFGVSSDMESLQPIGMRSSAADGSYEGTTYQVGPFVSTDYDQDIVWVGGFFVKWPSSL